MTTADLFDQVCHAAPQFAAVRDEHRKDNDELLPHVLMGDLGRYIASIFTGDKRVAADPPSEQQQGSLNLSTVWPQSNEGAAEDR